MRKSIVEQTHTFTVQDAIEEVNEAPIQIHQKIAEEPRIEAVVSTPVKTQKVVEKQEVTIDVQVKPYQKVVEKSL